jgi:hypothetical protein
MRRKEDFVYRFKLSFLMLVFTAFLSPFDFLHAQQPVVTTVPSGTQEQEYKLRLIFNGLISLAPAKGPDAKKAIWVLVGNASDPTKLAVARNMPPHMSHLFVRVKNEDGVDEATVSPSNVFTETLPMADFNQPGSWRGIQLDGQDLRLSFESDTKLRVERDRRYRFRPCDPKKWYLFCWPTKALRQRRNFNWTVNLPASIAKLKGDEPGKQLKDCLTNNDYDCQGPLNLLNARLKLDKGTVYVSHFVGEDEGADPGLPRPKLLRFALNAANFLYRPRAQADEVAVEFQVRGPINVLLQPLSGSQAKPTIRIDNLGAKIVEVRLVNHPTCALDKCLAEGFTDSDFLFNFNLLTNPRFVEPRSLPRPVRIDASKLRIHNDTTTFNAQCSPTSYIPDGLP